MSSEKDRRFSRTLTRRTMLRGLGVSMALPLDGIASGVGR